MEQVGCRARFQARFIRLTTTGGLANPEMMRRIDDRVWEIKVDQGPGRRVYGCYQQRVFVLTHGTNKPKPSGVKREAGRALKIFNYWLSKEYPRGVK